MVPRLHIAILIAAVPRFIITVIAVALSSYSVSAIILALVGPTDTDIIQVALVTLALQSGIVSDEVQRGIASSAHLQVVEELSMDAAGVSQAEPTHQKVGSV